MVESDETQSDASESDNVPGGSQYIDVYIL